MRRGVWLAVVLWGCGSSGGGSASPGQQGAVDAGGSDAVIDAARPIDAAPDASSAGPVVYLGCNVVAEPCQLPFPSSVLSRPDPTTPTGLRVDLSAVDFANIWGQLGGADCEGCRPEVYDGFSPVGPIVTRLPGTLRGALPIDYDASLAADAPVMLFAVADGARVPFHAVAVESEADRLLVLTPLRPLAASSRYAVVVTDGLLDPATRTAGMSALLSPDAGDALWHHYRPLIAALPALGLGSERVVQLWDFHTRSREGITRDLDVMTAYVSTWLRDHPPQPVIAPDGMAGARLRFSVEVEVPIWREDAKARLHRGDDGLPSPVRVERIRGILVISPDVTPDAPVHPLLFGHGLAANADLMARLMEDIELERGPFAAFLFDWDLHGTRGRGTEDIADIAGSLDTPAFSTAMLQSAADSLVFSAAAGRGTEVPGLGAVVRAEPPVYLGQSLGGLIGLIGATRNPDLPAAVLNVTGGGLAGVLRSGRVLDVLRLRTRVGRALRDAPLVGLSDDLALEVVLAMSQLGLDAGDPLNFAGDAHRPLLLQESVGDGIMPNLATETLARALALPLVTPALHDVPGLTNVAAPTGGQPPAGLTEFRTSADGFQAHLALAIPPVQRQAILWLASFLDPAVPDGDIAYDCPNASCDLVEE